MRHFSLIDAYLERSSLLQSPRNTFGMTLSQFAGIFSLFISANNKGLNRGQPQTWETPKRELLRIKLTITHDSSFFRKAFGWNSGSLRQNNILQGVSLPSLQGSSPPYPSLFRTATVRERTRETPGNYCMSDQHANSSSDITSDSRLQVIRIERVIRHKRKFIVCQYKLTHPTRTS